MKVQRPTDLWRVVPALRSRVNQHWRHSVCRDDSLHFFASELADSQGSQTGEPLYEEIWEILLSCSSFVGHVLFSTPLNFQQGIHPRTWSTQVFQIPSYEHYPEFQDGIVVSSAVGIQKKVLNKSRIEIKSNFLLCGFEGVVEESRNKRRGILNKSPLYSLYVDSAPFCAPHRLTAGLSILRLRLKTQKKAKVITF